jgi:hypothetical protein
MMLDFLIILALLAFVIIASHRALAGKRIGDPRAHDTTRRMSPSDWD